MGHQEPELWSVRRDERDHRKNGEQGMQGRHRVRAGYIKPPLKLEWTGPLVKH